MKDRSFVLLLFVIISLQLTTLYRQQHSSAVSQASTSPSNRFVADVKDSSATIDIRGMPIKGDSNAKVVLVEFSDYECPFCARHANGVGRELDRRFVSTGKVRYAFANNPLPIHSKAVMLATAAICAGRQNKYWEMHDNIFGNAPRERAQIVSIADTLGIDTNGFLDCLETDSEAISASVAKDREMAGDLQLSGTPGFVVGTIDQGGKLVIKKVIRGAQSIEVFDKILREFLL